MKHSLLLAYHCLAGFSDTSTGILLYLAPIFTLRMMGVDAPADVSPYVSYIGAFVLSVGLSYFYGAFLVAKRSAPERIEAVWLITALARSTVAIYVFRGILYGDLGSAWISVALFDGGCAAIQAFGLRKRWLADVG